MCKVLIIKTGYSETLDEAGSSTKCSLGDVLRHFYFLDHLKEELKYTSLTWLTDISAIQLFSLINTPMDIITNSDELELNQFDYIVNFEKGFLVENIPLHKIIGFNKIDGKLFVRNITLSNEPFDLTTKYSGAFEDQMEKVFGLKYRSTNLCLELTKDEPIYDWGLNFKAGPKWPTKELPKSFWESVYQGLEKEGLSLTWQQGFYDLREYIQWIQSCKSLITLDSLGLHIANLLGKEIVALFGPTSPEHVIVYKGLKLQYPPDKDIKELIQEVVNHCKL